MEPEWLKTAREKGLKITEGPRANIAADASEASGSAPGAGAPPPSVASEAEFQAAVIALAEAHGWRVAHCRKVLVKMGDRCQYETPMPAGWPDLTLARPGRLLFLELKFGANRPTDEQKAWGELFDTVKGCDWFVVYPRHWPLIVEQLTR